MPHIILDNQQKPVANIFCVGRNYVKHIEELNNAMPTEPLVFFKPTSSLHFTGSPIELPAYSEDVHYETEIVLYIGKDGKNIAEEDAYDYIEGYGLGLDLTARDVQTQEKTAGQPWSKSKGFPHAACLSSFVSSKQIPDPTNIDFTLQINGDDRQIGNTQHMIFPIATIINYLSHVYGLTKGDIIYTGTPEGVGPLKSGYQLRLTLPSLIDAEFSVK